MRIIIEEGKEEKPALSLGISLLIHFILFGLLITFPQFFKVELPYEEKPVEVVIPKKNPLKFKKEELLRKKKKQVNEKERKTQNRIKKSNPQVKKRTLPQRDEIQRRGLPQKKYSLPLPPDKRVYSDRMLKRKGKGGFFSGIKKEDEKRKGGGGGLLEVDPKKFNLKKFVLPQKKGGKNFYIFTPGKGGFGGWEGHGGGAYFETHGYNLDPWIEAVLRKVKKNWIPPLAAKAGIKGVNAFYLVFHRNGEVTDLTIIKSSGIPSFDQSSYGALWSSIPFPEFPDYYPYETIKARFVFYYNVYPER